MQRWQVKTLNFGTNRDVKVYQFYQEAQQLFDSLQVSQLCTMELLSKKREVVPNLQTLIVTIRNFVPYFLLECPYP
jgi:hypothetical protein